MLLKLLVSGLVCLGTNATPVWDSAEEDSTRLKGRSPLIKEEAPVHVLLPRHPPDHVPHDHAHLQLHKTKHLFFGQDHPKEPMREDSRYASTHSTFKHPAVVLDHSSHTITTLKGDVMEVQFGEWSPYVTARANWTDEGLPFLLVTTVGSKDGHFVYYLTDWIECIDATLVCNLGVESSELEHVGDEFELEFGHWSDNEKRNINLSPLVSRDPPIPDSTPDVPTEPASPISSFDIALDEQAGFYEWSPETFAEDLGDFADDITDFDYNHYNSTAIDVGGIYDVNGTIKGDFILEPVESDYNITKIRKRLVAVQKNNHKRLFEIRSASGKVVSAEPKIVSNLKDAFVKGKQKIGDAFQNVKDQFFNLYEEVKKWVDGTPNSWEAAKSYSRPDSDQKYVTQNAFARQDGTLMNAISLFESSKGGATINAYCLDCKATAGIRIKGTIGYKWGEGLKHASLGVKGNFEATAYLGIVAQYQYLVNPKRRIFEMGLPLFSVPPFFSIGPMGTLDLAGTFDLKLAGRILAGFTATLNNVDAVIDIKNFDNSKSPAFNPVITPTGYVSGAMSANFSLSAQLGLAFGISIGAGFFRSDAALISEPGLTISARGAAMASLTGGVNTATDGCQGVKLDFDLHHELYGQLAIKLGSKLDVTRKKPIMEKFQRNIGGKCLGRQTKRQIDNGTAVAAGDGEVFDTIDWDMAAVELEPDNGQDLYMSEFADDQYKVPSAVEAFLDRPPTLASNINALNTNNEETAFNYSIVVDTSLEYMLTSTTEGNLALQSTDTDTDPNNVFAYYDNVLIGDAFGRFLVYYDGEMARYNASRIRMVLPERIPKSSKAISLWPIDIGPTPQAEPGVDSDLLVAFDSSANFYYPVLCNYVGDIFASKMFIVSDPESGIAALKSDETDQTLTGSPIEKCNLLGLLTIVTS